MSAPRLSLLMLAAASLLATPARALAESPAGDATAPPTDNPAPLPAPAHLERTVETVDAEGPPPHHRPRFNVAVGMGTSFERAGFSPARTELVPGFFAMAGFGDDWPVGVELAAFASSASGRFQSPDAPIDRLALAAIAVLRPYGFTLDVEDNLYGARVLRTLAFEVGPAFERDGTTTRSGSRWGVHTGARLELPILPLSGSTGRELRLRLAARRMFGLYTPRVGDVDVGDGRLEVFAALVVTF